MLTLGSPLGVNIPKETVIHEIRPPSSVASLSSSDTHVTIVGPFGGGQRQKAVMHCVFWHCSIRTTIRFFSSSCCSASSVGLDNTDRSLSAHEPGCPSFDHHCRPGAPNRTCSFREAPTELCRHQNFVPLKVLTLDHFSPSRTKSSLAARYISPTNRCHCNKIINVTGSTGWSVHVL